MNARKLVLEILRQFDERRGTLEALLDRFLSRGGLDRRDRRFVYELVHGTLRHRIRLRYTVTQYLTDRELGRNDELMRILELGLYQILHLDRAPNHAAVSESVNLAKGSPRTRRFTGVVNAVLRAVIKARGQVDLPDPRKGLSTRLSVEFAHPQWLVDRWLGRYDLARTRALLAFNNQVPAVYLRRRIRGMGRQQFETDSRGVCDRVGGFGNLYYRLARRGLAPEDVRLFQLGYCTVQAPSAGWVVAMLDLQSGDRCVDVCSAPGGKAALMAEVCGEEGSVCACDASLPRLRRVTEGCDRLGLRNVYPVAADGVRPPFAGYFDKALLDVPCSGTGVLHRHPDARATRMEEDILQVAKVQEGILEGSMELVGPGGVVVYATCSLEPEENEGQVSKFLDRHSDFELVKPPRGIPPQYVDLDGFLRITPFEHQLDGAFAAILRKRRAGV